jgi:hypothetical protein
VRAVIGPWPKLGPKAARMYNCFAMAQKWGATIKPRLAILFIAVLPLALVIAAACRGGGGGDGLTLEEYFEQLDVILETSDIELETLQMEYLENPEGTQGWVQVAAFQDLCAGLVEHYRRVVEDLESIDAPPLVRGAHDEYIATQVEALHFFAAIKDRAWRVSTLDEYIEVVTDARGSTRKEIEDRESEWCFSLEQIGVRNGIEVDLGCFE